MKFFYFMLICGLLCQQMCIVQFGNVRVKRLKIVAEDMMIVAQW